MATLEELTGRQVTTAPTSSAVSASKGLAARDYQVGSSLADDLLRSMRVKAESLNTVAAVGKEIIGDMGAKVANDKNVELALYIEEQKKVLANDPSNPDLIDNVSRAIEEKYAELANVKFTLPEMQRQFDDGFTKPAAVSVAKIGTRLYEDSRQHADNQLTALTLDGVRTVVNSGMEASEEAIKGAVDTVTAYKGKEYEEKGQLIVAKEFTTSFKNRATMNPKALLRQSNYKAEEGFTPKVAKSIFDSVFSGWGSLNDKGEIVFKPYVKRSAQDEIRNTWKGFYRSMTSDGGKPYNSRFKSNNHAMGQMKSDYQSTYVPASQMRETLKALELNAEQARLELPTTNSDEQTYKQHYADIMNVIDQRDIIEKDMSIADKTFTGQLAFNPDKADDFRNYMEDGKEVEMFDHNAKKWVKTKIPASEYKKIYDTTLAKVSDNLLKADVSTEQGKNIFLSGLKKISELEYIGRASSPVTRKYEMVLNSNTQVPSFNKREIDQYLTYERFRAMSDKGRENQQSFFNDVRTSLAAIDPKHPEYEKKYRATFYNMLAQEKQGRLAQLTSGSMDREIKTVIEKLETGDDRWDLVFNAEAAQGAALAFKQYAANNGKVGNLGQLMKDIPILDYGTTPPAGTPFIGSPDRRALAPIGVNERVTEGALDTLRIQYNKAAVKDLDRDDVILENMYDPVSKNIKIIMRDKENTNIIIGEVTARNGNILVKKGEELEPAWYNILSD